MTWSSLHNHSQYSILDSTASVQALAKQAEKFEMESIALTDSGNMHGAVDFYKACKAHHVKPIIGLEIQVAPESRFEKKRIYGKASGYPIILLAKNAVGYRNLCKLSSFGFTEGFYYTPRVDMNLLEEYTEGLICLLGGTESEFSQLVLVDHEKAKEKLLIFQKMYKDNLYLELLRHPMKEEDLKNDGIFQESWYYQKYLDHIRDQTKINASIIEFSKSQSIKVAASHDVHYIHKDDWKAHEILMNIQSGEPTEIWEKDAQGRPKSRVLNPKRQVKPSHENYFKSQAEITNLYSDLKEAVEATTEIAKQCNFAFDFNKRFYPVFIPPKLEGKIFDEATREKESTQFLKELCQEGVKKRYTPERLEKVAEKYPGKDPLIVVKERLDYEFEIITSKGMGDYLLIVYDFIAWAKRNRIPMGPGRGSGAGSIVLYLIGITDIEPLRFNLFFERFINPERISYPDIDVDICMDRRSEVIDYTIKKYGKERVAQIITFGTMKAKMAIKDVGRVLSVPLAKVNEIAKLIPEDPNMTLEKALEIDPDLQRMVEEDEEAKRIIDLGKKVEGSIRNTGIHAAGLIICADPLTDHIPVCIPKESSMAATQFSMKPVESVGMLKIDFLGLKTLTSIQKAVDAIKESKNIDIDWVNLPLNDTVTFNLLNQGKTLGVFQLESSGMQDLAKQLHIDKFEEIIAVGALYRPGPMEMIPSFINRKHGREKIEYDHPFLKDVLSETYGIMVYQEQVMQIASLLANYSLGEGDLLRKAMGKKDKDEMARQKIKFREGAVKKGIDEALAVQIFDKIEKFASYGFNKSHATAYGFLSYVTAYLKSNFTKEWLAALMTCDIDDLSKVAKHIRESQSFGIDILSPDVNESKEEFVATERGIRFALCAIKGVGKAVVDSIVEERKKSGSFSSLYDFVSRIDTKKIGKKLIEILIAAGCFDFTSWSRQALLQTLDPIYESVLQEQKEASKGFIDLFGSKETIKNQRFMAPPDVLEPISQSAILSKEKELLGFFLSGHPMEQHQKLIKDCGCFSLQDLEDIKVAKVAFIIEAVQTRISKTQRKFAILTISDGLERQEVPLWPDLYEKYAPLIIENHLFAAVVQIDKEEDSLKLRLRWLAELETCASEEVRLELENTYDNVASEVARFKNRSDAKKTGEEAPLSDEKKKEMTEKKLKLLIKCKAPAIKHSHVLQLKKIFTDAQGHISVDVLFLSQEEKPLGLIAIGNEWGVRYDAQLETQLKHLPFVIGVQLVCLE
jgi:DNA polymerase-3 subunit alpha